jgi:hypothetical protein
MPARYCVVIQLDNLSDMARVNADVPPILALMKGHSEKDEMAFRSTDGVLFGWFIQTSKPIDMIRKAIEASTAWRNRDSIMIFEIGEGLSGKGFTRQWTWLQHSAK